jgi:ribosomal protein S18 acetylase RimI-like enzyme
VRHLLVPGPDAPLAALGAVEGARLVGLAFAARSNRAGMGVIDGAVDPTCRGRGVGRALLSSCWAGLAELAPQAVDVEAEDTAESLGFLERRGFVRHESDVYWSLDPSVTDLSGLDALDASRQAEGFRVVSLAEVIAREAELHALWEAARSRPGEEPREPLTPEGWRRRVIERPHLDAEMSVVVMAGDRPVALAFLEVDTATGRGENMMTATHPDVRRRGLARLAKLHTIRSARAAGLATILTSNAAANEDMVALNRALGYANPVRVWTLRRGYDGESTPSRKDAV